MNQKEKDILAILGSINSAGSFSSSGTFDFITPGLKVKEFGEIGFPFNKTQAKELIKFAKKAPFGKGSETVLDENIRKSWAIDASQISFNNKKWSKTLNKILDKVQEDLGLENRLVEASLYKLLIYEKGGFFLPHQDSEKEPGMFGTLVIGLPSAHTGGKFHLRFDGKEEIIDFSKAGKDYSLPFVGFFADCEHEIKPVTKGYRLSLTYNLVQKKGSTITAPIFKEQVSDLTEVMGQWHKQAETLPAVILLDHQYTPSNFSFDRLKLHDTPRVQAIFDAAEKADCFASLGLVTHHQSGELDADYNYNSRRSYGRRRGYYDDYEEEDYSDAEIGEIYEEDTTLTGIKTKGLPSLGTIILRPDEIIMEEDELGIGQEPLKKQAEGYTGNAGMTMDYWYHYGAVFFWPKKLHADLLIRRPLSVQIDWLNHYMKKFKKSDKAQNKIIKKIIERVNQFNPDKNAYRSHEIDINLDGLILALVELKDKKSFENIYLFLSKNFTKVKAKNWVKIIDQFGKTNFNILVQQTLEQKKIKDLKHIFDLLILLNKNKHTDIAFFLDKIPHYLNINKIQLLDSETWHYNFEVSEKDQKIKSLVKLIKISKEKETDTDWQDQTHKALTENLLREYSNEVLFPLIKKSKDKQLTLYKNIKQSLIIDLEKRTAVKPQPTKDFARKAPRAKGRDAEVWKMLKDFIESSTQEVYDYVANESYRKDVSYALSRVEIDLRTETIRKGRPYTLRIIKTQKAYEKKLAQWKEDVKLLNKIK